MAPPSLFSPISNRAPVLCLHLSSTPCFSTLRDQAPGSACVPNFVSDVAVFPFLLKDCGFDPFCPSVGGSHEQWPNEQGLNIECTQECPLDPVVAGALRLWPGASLPQEKFAR